MDILKLFSAISGLFDSPPNISQKQQETKKEVKPQNKNNVCSFISAHDKLSQKIRGQNKKN